MPELRSNFDDFTRCDLTLHRKTARFDLLLLRRQFSCPSDAYGLPRCSALPHLERARCSFFTTGASASGHSASKGSFECTLRERNMPSRQVPNTRGGRVFFVGDAAHAHSPAGGQGMRARIALADKQCRSGFPLS